MQMLGFSPGVEKFPKPRRLRARIAKRMNLGFIQAQKIGDRHRRAERPAGGGIVPDAVVRRPDAHANPATGLKAPQHGSQRRVAVVPAAIAITAGTTTQPGWTTEARCRSSTSRMWHRPPYRNDNLALSMAPVLPAAPIERCQASTCGPAPSCGLQPCWQRHRA